jgi:arginyl-tRNA synthetase
LTRYAIELARSFHDFYEKERVIGEAEPVFAARLALVRAAAQVFRNLFGLLGISAPEKM